ncbi:MAG: LysR family transcriptional regulator [Rhodobacteraceae bacterium]|nr:LysR family transcriptional regulator [Paracoccaceae bacterium]
MSKPDLSLKALDVFQRAARAGSVLSVAEETGLAASTVSHHLRTLEEQLGVPLLDHSRRPMVLTPQGAAFLKHVEAALTLIRRARAEAVAGEASAARQLRLGLIEDFDSDIAPDLAVLLAQGMPNCDFTHITGPSHDILALLGKRRIEIGLATQPVDTPDDLLVRPMLRDPFVVALPAGESRTPEDFLTGSTDLPFLRYSAGQIIGGLIEAQLRRLRVSLPHRFEIESNQTLMAMIASGAGWAITTPLCYARARRFHGQVTLHPFPAKGFARTIALYATTDCTDSVLSLVDGTLRNLIQRHALSPVQGQMPWLDPAFRLLSPDP